MGTLAADSTVRSYAISESKAIAFVFIGLCVVAVTAEVGAVAAEPTVSLSLLLFINKFREEGYFEISLDSE